jgi:hypothetical protein
MSVNTPSAVRIARICVVVTSTLTTLNLTGGQAIPGLSKSPLGPVQRGKRYPSERHPVDCVSQGLGIVGELDNRTRAGRKYSPHTVRRRPPGQPESSPNHNGLSPSTHPNYVPANSP